MEKSEEVVFVLVHFKLEKKIYIILVFNQTGLRLFLFEVFVFFLLIMLIMFQTVVFAEICKSCEPPAMCLWSRGSSDLECICPHGLANVCNTSCYDTGKRNKHSR